MREALLRQVRLDACHHGIQRGVFEEDHAFRIDEVERGEVPQVVERGVRAAAGVVEDVWEADLVGGEGFRGLDVDVGVHA